MAHPAAPWSCSAAPVAPTAAAFMGGGEIGEAFGDSLDDSPLSTTAVGFPCRSRVEDAIRASERLSLMAGQGTLRKSATEHQKADAAALLADVLRAVLQVSQAHGISLEQSVQKRLRCLMMEFPPADDSLRMPSATNDDDDDFEQRGYFVQPHQQGGGDASSMSPIARQFHRMMGEGPQECGGTSSQGSATAGYNRGGVGHAVHSSASSSSLHEDERRSKRTASVATLPPSVPLSTNRNVSVDSPNGDAPTKGTTSAATPKPSVGQHTTPSAAMEGPVTPATAVVPPSGNSACLQTPTPPLVHKTSSSSIESGGEHSSLRKVAMPGSAGSGGGAASLIYLVGRSPQLSDGGDNPLGPGYLASPSTNYSHHQPHQYPLHHSTRRRAEGSSQPSSLSTPLSRNPSSSVAEYIDGVLMPEDSPRDFGVLDDPVHAQYMREGSSGGTLVQNNSLVAVSPMTPAELGLRQSLHGDGLVPVASSSVTSLKQSYREGSGGGNATRCSGGASAAAAPPSARGAHVLQQVAVVPTVAGSGRHARGSAPAASIGSVSANTSYEQQSKAHAHTNPLEGRSSSSGGGGSSAASPNDTGPTPRITPASPNQGSSHNAVTAPHASSCATHPAIQQVAALGRVVSLSGSGTTLRVLYGIELLQEAAGL